MEIRKAQSRDIPGMIELLKQVGEVHHRIRPDIFRSGAQKYDEAALAQLLLDESRPIFIAEEDGTVLGYAFCIHKVTAHNPVLLDQRELYIDDLCVDGSCRGMGVGKKLYEYVLAYAREEKFDSLTLNVWCGNDGAMRFYEKAGLKPRNIYMEMRLEDN